MNANDKGVLAVMEPRRYDVIAQQRGFPQPMVIGQVVRSESGWAYFPNYQANPSRKRWPTPDAALKGRVKSYTLEARP